MSLRDRQRDALIIDSSELVDDRTCPSVFSQREYGQDGIPAKNARKFYSLVQTSHDLECRFAIRSGIELGESFEHFREWIDVLLSPRC